MSVDTNPSGAHDEAFLQVLAHHTMLRAYIFAIVRDPHLAEDTLSDTTLAVIHAWERFDRRRPFAPWARGITRRVALANLRKAHHSGIGLDEDVLEAVGVYLDSLGSEANLEERRHALRRCLEQLPEHSRELVQRRYFDEQSYERIVQHTGRSITSLYKAFSRIHEALAECVKRKLAHA
jgi:RNA polymerase sigma-70 factor